MATEKYIPLQDEDSHWFRVPESKVEKFKKMCEEAYQTEEFDDFIDEFSGYMTGGGPNKQLEEEN